MLRNSKKCSEYLAISRFMEFSKFGKSFLLGISKTESFRRFGKVCGGHSVSVVVVDELVVIHMYL